MMKGAGRLRERFSFDKRAAAVDDGYGTTTAAFFAEFDRAAALTPLRRGEAVIASRLEGVQPYILEVRSDSQTRCITTDWRCSDNRTGTIYNIRTVEPSPDRSMISMIIEAGVADG